MTDLREQREQIAEAIRHWHGARATICEHTQVISFGEAADAVMAVIEDEAIDRMAEQFVAETRLRSMDFRNGFAMDVEASRTLVANWVGAARGMLGDAENYSETPITMTVKVAEDPERFVFTLQRVGKLTPHQARKAAEERADQAEGERDKAIERADRAQAALDAIDREVRWHETGASWGPSHTLRQVREHLRKAKSDDPA